MLTRSVPGFPTDKALGGSLGWLAADDVLEACRGQLSSIPRGVRDAWKDCRLIEALYHPGRYIRSAYVLLDEPDVPANRAWPQGQIIYVHAPVRHPVSRRGTVIRLGGIEAEVYRFPNDRRLRGLRKFAGASSAAATWQTWIGESSSDQRIDPDSLQRLLVRYVPEQKWVVRLRAMVTGGGRADLRRIAVRSASARQCAHLAELHTTLATSPANEAKPFVVPGLVGLEKEQGLLAVEWIRGGTLLDALRANPAEGVLDRVYRILSAFHQTRLPNLARLTARDLADRVTDAASDLACVCPDLASRIEELRGHLLPRMGRLDPAQPATLHNDFHWNQLTIKHDRWTLLDLERACVGDPWVDAANVVVQLDMLGHRPEMGVDPVTSEGWATTFLERWSRDHGFDMERFTCYSVVSLLELARGMMRHLRPGWRELADKCVQRAEARAYAPKSEVRAS